eukprot:scaffold104821_cov45-Phaeocystis_antarctica.AAC.1
MVHADALVAYVSPAEVVGVVEPDEPAEAEAAAAAEAAAEAAGGAVPTAADGGGFGAAVPFGR